MIKVNLLKDAGNKKLTESTIFDSKIKNSFTSVVVENNALVKRIFFSGYAIYRGFYLHVVY